MSHLPGFDVLLGRLANRRELNSRHLSDAAGLSETEVDAVLSGAAPSPLFLRRTASALQLHAVDLFVIAGTPVPEELEPLDGRAGALVPVLAQDAARLPPESRSRLLGFVRSLPQHDRTQPVAVKKAYEQYPQGFGGMLLRMFGNRNLNLEDSTAVLARLTGECGYLSSSSVAMVGRGRKEVTPDLLGNMGAVLGIRVMDLAALGDINLPGGSLPVRPAVADAAELIWEVRRLTVEQVRQVHEKTKSMGSQLSSDMDVYHFCGHHVERGTEAVGAGKLPAVRRRNAGSFPSPAGGAGFECSESRARAMGRNRVMSA